MKTIKVDIYAFYGFGCCGCSYSSDEEKEIEVSEEAAATIKSMLDECNASETSLNEEVFSEAIQAGHAELGPVLETLKDKHQDMVIRYWLFEAENEFIDESLEPYFWEDIEKGLYKPARSLEQFAEDPYDDEEEVYDDYDETQLADEERVRNLYYYRHRDRYLEWVNGNEDYGFVAERTGLDLGAVLDSIPDLEFVVNEVK